MPNDDPVLLGAWVRFYQGGQLVIGEVEEGLEASRKGATDE